MAVNATTLPYYEDPAPGANRRRPRASVPSTGARTMSLNSDWAFTLSPTAAGTGDAFHLDDLDDSGWDRIPVPSHWVLEGYGDPLYTNTAYPFPIRPPHVPRANPTGDYRYRFHVEADWRLPGSVLRFEGVDSCAAVWLNGHFLGHSKGSRLPFEFDVGTMLRAGENFLAVRVHRWSSGSYLEDQDMWWLPGIFRDVTLLERAPGGIDDHVLHAGYDHLTGEGTLRFETTDADGRDLHSTLSIASLGVVDLPAGQEVRIPGVTPWSAEVPQLYEGVIRCAGEELVVRLGFRTVEIRDGVFTVNGVPVRMRGVNRHEHDPDHGRALSEETMRTDILMMKAHHINAVRTAHYPPHPRFLDLCDELGMWVVDESDIETHGFIYAGWEGNPPDDPVWEAALLDRIQRMVERDKNHPSVVVWSLANESEGGAAFAAIESWIRERDPSRPLHYERDRTYAHSDFYSVMYPSLEDLEAIVTRTEETPPALSGLPELEARRRALPFLLCEYAHAMGNGPGSLVDYQELLESTDRSAGAFVWEWIDHGFRGRTAEGVEFFRHGGDIDHEPNGGTYCIDGLVRPDRVPSPGLRELAKVLEPVRIRVSGDAIHVRNEFDVSDTSALKFTWEVSRDGRTYDAGCLDVPVIPARGFTSVPLPEVAVPSDGADAREHWLTVSARLRDDVPWAAAGHEIGWGQGRPDFAPHTRDASRRDPDAVLRAPRGGDASQEQGPLAPDTAEIGPARLDLHTGQLRTLAGVDVEGPLPSVWRAPTENDRGQGELNNLARTWRLVGLDRMIHDVRAVDRTAGGVAVQSRLAPATQAFGLDVTQTWSTGPDGARAVLRVDVDPYGPWAETPYGHHEVTLPRLGVELVLPGGYERVRWFGLGPGEAYVDSRAAARVGQFDSAIDALGFDYVVPQENGNRHQTRWLELSGGGQPTLLVEGDPLFDFAARRWSVADLTAASHPHHFRDSGHVHLTLDHAHHGLGSASCGPATPARYRVQPIPRTFTLTFAVSPSFDSRSL